MRDMVLRKPSGFRNRQAFGTNAERLANRFDKAVILTDGYASMKEDSQELLKDRKFIALTVLFGSKIGSPESEALGDVVQLDEVIV